MFGRIKTSAIAKPTPKETPVSWFLVASAACYIWTTVVVHSSYGSCYWILYVYYLFIVSATRGRRWRRGVSGCYNISWTAWTDREYSNIHYSLLIMITWLHSEGQRSRSQQACCDLDLCLDRFFSATWVFGFIFPFFSFLCGALDWAAHLVSFWLYVNLPYRIIKSQPCYLHHLCTTILIIIIIIKSLLLWCRCKVVT